VILISIKTSPLVLQLELEPGTSTMLQTAVTYRPTRCSLTRLRPRSDLLGIGLLVSIHVEMNGP